MTKVRSSLAGEGPARDPSRNAGETRHAADAYRAARGAGSGGFIQPTLELDRAVSLIRDREIEEACRLATALFTTLSSEQRVSLLRDKLVVTLDQVPPRYRHLTCVTELHDLAATATA